MRRRKKKEGERTSTLGEIKGGESGGVGTPKVEYVEKGIKNTLWGKRGRKTKEEKNEH